MKTPEEIQKQVVRIKEMREKGYSIAEIARSMGLTESTVRYHLKK